MIENKNQFRVVVLLINFSVFRFSNAFKFLNNGRFILTFNIKHKKSLNQ